jgi:putative membrane protein
MMDADHFFSTAEKERIAATIQAVEQKTAGEIAVMVVDESDAYPESVLLGAVTLGGLVALAITDRFLGDSLWLFVPCVALCALLTGQVLKRLSAVRRLFVSPRQSNQRVQIRAERSFYAKGLHETRDHSGVLFFISLFERKVWVLADQGIYQKIGQEELQSYASQITAGMKSSRKCEILCDEITRFGNTLALHFPIRPEDRNELSNEVIVEGHGRKS